MLAGFFKLATKGQAQEKSRILEFVVDLDGLTFRMSHSRMFQPLQSRGSLASL